MGVLVPLTVNYVYDYRGYRGVMQKCVDQKPVQDVNELKQRLKNGHEFSRASLMRSSYAAFTPDTCSPDTKLYPFVSPVAVYIHVYPVSATKLSSRRHLSTYIRIQVVLRDTCRRLYVSGVNAALIHLSKPAQSQRQTL